MILTQGTATVERHDIRLRLTRDDTRIAADVPVHPITVLASMRPDIEHRSAADLPPEHKSQLGPRPAQAIPQ